MGRVLARTPWFLPSPGLNPRVAYMRVRLNPTGFISHPIPPQTAGISPGFDTRLPSRGRKPRLVFSKEKGGEGESGGGGSPAAPTPAGKDWATARGRSGRSLISSEGRLLRLSSRSPSASSAATVGYFGVPPQGFTPARSSPLLISRDSHHLFRR